MVFSKTSILYAACALAAVLANPASARAQTLVGAQNPSQLRGVFGGWIDGLRVTDDGTSATVIGVALYDKPATVTLTDCGGNSANCTSFVFKMIFPDQTTMTSADVRDFQSDHPAYTVYVDDKKRPVIEWKVHTSPQIPFPQFQKYLYDLKDTVSSFQDLIELYE